LGFWLPRAFAAVAVRAAVGGSAGAGGLTTYNQKIRPDYDRCFPPAKRLMALQRGSKILRRIAGAEDTNDARSVRGNDADDR
jgi:uncharacterized alpha/beta hydrolase family protein